MTFNVYCLTQYAFKYWDDYKWALKQTSWNDAYNILLWCLIVSFTLVEYNMRYLLTFFVFKLWIVVVDLFHTSYRMLHYMSQWWYTMIHRLIQYIFSLKCNPRTFVLLFKTSPNEMKTNTKISLSPKKHCGCISNGLLFPPWYNMLDFRVSRFPCIKSKHYSLRECI